jgi:hypothetical protein
MTFIFTAVVKATAAKFNFAACSRHAKCSFRVRLHTKNIKKHHHSKIDQLHKFAGGFFFAFGSKFCNAGRIGGARGPVLARGP